MFSETLPVETSADPAALCLYRCRVALFFGIMSRWRIQFYGSGWAATRDPGQGGCPKRRPPPGQEVVRPPPVVTFVPEAFGIQSLLGLFLLYRFVTFGSLSVWNPAFGCFHYTALDLRAFTAAAPSDHSGCHSVLEA